MNNLSNTDTGNNANLMLYAVLNQWDNNKQVYKGNLEDCKKYISGNNVYGLSYSKLVLRQLNGI